MTTVGLENLDLVKYLVSQVMMSDKDRLNELRKYYPDAKAEDWRLSQGGQRVQIIKKEPGKPATLQFGTEIFASKDGAVTALLGASPGASTSPYIMLNLLEKAFLRCGRLCRGGTGITIRIWTACRRGRMRTSWCA